MYSARPHIAPGGNRQPRPPFVPDASERRQPPPMMAVVDGPNPYRAVSGPFGPYRARRSAYLVVFVDLNFYI